MGQFIDEVAKNNALQREYMSEKARLQAKKEQERQERYNEREYKQEYNTIKRNALDALYIEISTLFLDYGTIIYDVYNNDEKRQEIINNIISNNPEYTSELNSDDLRRILIELNKKYFTILQQQYNITKKIQQSKLNLMVEEEKNNTNTNTNTNTNNTIFYILYVIFISICTFIHELFKPHTNKYTRRRRLY